MTNRQLNQNNFGWIDIHEMRDTKTLDEKDIIYCMKNLLAEFRKKKSKSERTRLIKKQLVVLGHKQGYKAYANRLTEEDRDEIKKYGVEGFVNREWLFDLHWYTEPPNTNYQMEKMPLVAECEWESKRKEDIKGICYSAMKYDFQKLLIANADLRLMIFKLRKHNDLEHLNQYFEESINNFKKLENSARFLIITFYRDIFLYKIIKKGHGQQ